MTKFYKLNINIRIKISLIGIQFPDTPSGAIGPGPLRGEQT